MKKRALIAAALTAVFAIGVQAAFERTRQYTAGQFTDVAAEAWYAGSVADAYEIGFMRGTAENAFSPDDGVTVAEGITMASRIHAINGGEAAPGNSESGNWYDSYVAYAVGKGIITAETFDDYERPMTRAEMATVFCDALPADYFTAINAVDAVPDVNERAPYAEKILRLYRAGVVMGSDKYGTSNPDASIKRSECAAIIVRVALPQNRLQKTLEKDPTPDAYVLVEQEAAHYGNSISRSEGSTIENISSGWLLDNRGGIPRYSVEYPVVPLKDISTTEGTALIRKVNPVSEGVLTADFAVTPDGDGAMAQFCAPDGAVVYEARFDGKAWSVGGVKAPETLGENGSTFAFRVILDLGAKTAKTFINGAACGESTLAGNVIGDFRFATDEKGTASLMPGYVNITANYAVNENFDLIAPDALTGYTAANVKVDNKELVFDGAASLTKSFPAFTGKYVFSTYFLLPENENITFSLTSGGYPVAVLAAADGKLSANGTELYTLTKNMWYRLRAEANPTTESIKVILNGQCLGEVAAPGMTADTFTVATASGSARIDNLLVFATPDHPDYAPAPEKKARLDDYVVMVNVCSLWRNNSKHYGWSVISPFADNKPLYGWYDEGNPETADWEITYMVDHGIDVQAFCWFNDVSEGPLKQPNWSAALHDGYQLAKYSDYMKYVLLLELSASKGFDSAQFRNYVVPYWFENYFLDERYLKLDNKIVIHTYNIPALASDKFFGTERAARAELEWLDKKAKEYGFDGVIILGTHASSLIDGYAAYSWGANGFSADHNINQNLSMFDKGKAADPSFYMVPTVSVGYNVVAWLGSRQPMMSVGDYRKTNEWVRDTYLPEKANKENWQKNLVVLSTWNEYGEGTYIAPAGLNGFGYLDVLRDVYTDFDTPAANVVPDAEQIARIGRLYPQDLTLPGRLHMLPGDAGLAEETNTDDLEVKYVYEVREDNVQLGACDEILFSENGVHATATPVTYTTNGGDPRVELFSFDEPIKCEDVTYLRVNIEAPAGSDFQMFFTTDKDAELSEGKSFKTTLNKEGMNSYIINTTANPNWTGNLVMLRVDPFNYEGWSFTLKSVEFLGDADKGDEPTLTVNTRAIESVIPYEEVNGKVLFPFDPDTAVHETMHTFTTWQREKGVLTVEGNHHKVVFTVGSDKYTVDGAEKPLGYELYLVDGVPMMDFEILANALGLEVLKDGAALEIRTANYERYESVLKREEGIWEFNDFDTEGWETNHFTTDIGKGYLSLTSVDPEYQDPVVYCHGLTMPAKKFISAELRVRYAYAGRSYAEGTTNTDRMCFYFITDKDGHWNEEKKLRAIDNYKGRDSKGEWEVYTMDLATVETWQDVITDLRFDPFDAYGTIDIDYIRFKVNPDYDPAEEEARKHMIQNGDAEDTSYVALRPNSHEVVTIEEDAKQAGNHVYRITGPTGKTWAYALQDYAFEKGKTYRIAFDVRALPDSAGNSVDYLIACNLQYPDRIGSLQNGTGRDHVVGPTVTAPADGEWAHFEFDYRVASIDVPNSGAFSVYCNPPSENSSGIYELDNLSITVLED